MSSHTQDNLNARERILASAETIFLQDGFDSTSIRELTEAAGVNVALVNYYFGSKRNLYLEVLRRKFSTAAAQKCQALGEKLAAQTEPDLHQVISAYVELYLGSDQSAQATQQFLKLISRHFSEDEDAMELLLEELVIPIHQLMKRSIRQIDPQLDSNKLSLCIGSITGQIFHFLRFPHAFKTLVQLPENKILREEMAKHIIEFSLKGIQEEHPCDLIP